MIYKAPQMKDSSSGGPHHFDCLAECNTSLKHIKCKNFWGVTEVYGGF